MTNLTATDFNERYTFNEDIISIALDNDSQSGMLETFGDDLEQVLDIASKTPNVVWTMVNTDKGVELVTGYHLVNRICYVITNEPWSSADEAYFFDIIDDDDIMV
jgi:hypothetical protein